MAGSVMQRFGGHPSAWRLAAWMGLVVMLAVRVLLQVADLPVIAAVTLMDLLTYELPMALTIVAGGALLFRTVKGTEHRFWGTLVTATALTLPAELYWTWYVAAVDVRGPELGFAQVLQLLAALIFIAAVVSMTTLSEEPVTTQLRFFLDVLALAAISYPIVYLYWTQPAFEAVTDVRRNFAGPGALYPIFGGILFIAAVGIGLSWRQRHWRMWERTIPLALSVAGLGMVSFPIWYPRMVMSDALATSWLTLPFGAAHYLIFVSAVYRLTADVPLRVEPWPLPRIGSERLWRFFPVLLAIAVLVTGWLSATTHDKAAGRTLLDAAVVTALIVAVRSWLSALERVQHRRRAMTEPLTGALAADALMPALRRRLATAAHGGRELSVVVVGLLGADPRIGVGQTGRDAAVSRLHATMRDLAPSDTPIFRHQPLSFVALIERFSADDALLYAVCVWQELANAAELRDPGFDLAAGIATFPIHGMEATDLLARAEVAQSQARWLPQAPVQIWTEGLDETIPPDAVAAVRMRTLRATVSGLAQAVDARDPTTKDHSTNVAELVTALAQISDVPADRIELLGLAALVHDVGKVALDDALLSKPAPLTDEERSLVESHAVLSERIVAAARLNDLLPIVRHHHERWDGTGYPDGLAGEQIPLESRVLAVCDAFEVMTSGRQWAEPRSVASALGELESLAGTQFDPDVVNRFARLLAGMGALKRGDSMVMTVTDGRMTAS